MRSCTCPPTSRWWRSRRAPATRCHVVAVDQFAGAARRHAARCSISATGRSGTSRRPAESWLEAEDRVDGWRADARRRRRAGPGRRCGGLERGARAIGWASSSPASRTLTAVFVANDQMALGVLRALHEAGSRDPPGGSIVGFDDIPEAAVLQPAAHHRPPGLRRVGRSSLAPAARAHAGHRSAPSAGDHRPGARGAPQHRAAAQAVGRGRRGTRGGTRSLQIA